MLQRIKEALLVDNGGVCLENPRRRGSAATILLSYQPVWEKVHCGTKFSADVFLILSTGNQFLLIGRRTYSSLFFSQSFAWQRPRVNPKMAGSKLSKARDDKTKKRKGDVIENDARSKRPRAQQGKGAEAQTGDSKSINGPPKSLVLHGQDHKVGGLIGDGETGWRISKPMGGRMLDIDPILTADEE